MALVRKRSFANLLATRRRASRRPPPVGDEPVLRAELFNAEQMARHGELLAGLHTLGSAHGSDRLLARLAANEASLARVWELLTAAARANLQITPASEWLLDNFYLIEEHIHTARLHFPKSYSRGLPRLATGVSRGLPRVYDIALEIISHGDGRVDADGLRRFVAAYQTSARLTLGELWAIPIMLRLALIENLRRIGTRIGISRNQRDVAGHWADQMIVMLEHDPKSLVLGIADMTESGPAMTGSFVAEFVRRLQGQGSAMRLPLSWIEQSLAESGQTVEQLVRAENQEQAAEQVSISNSIASLRFLEASDWREFVETLSCVEATLRQDPGGVYANMDFSTRDRYRKVVEHLALASQLPEAEVARRVVQLARTAAAEHGALQRAAHVGFYLIDDGRAHFERALGVRRSGRERLHAACRRRPLLLYAGSIALLSFIVAGALLVMAYFSGASVWQLVATGILALVSASYLVVALVNWVATRITLPQLLPRMQYARGIPPELRTLVAVPALLTSARDIERLVEGLEVRFLGNRDEHLAFCLLTDFQDAREPTTPRDEPLLQLVRSRVQELNARYPGTSGDTFFLLHRSRCWNPAEKTWMGYERKRGKIADLNALLRGDGTGRFTSTVGDTTALRDVKYVITLDADTQMPRDCARELVGVMAHPLNRPEYDPARACIRRGYGVIQPRVAISLPSIMRTRYARWFGGEPGVDPYTRAVSDVYQDLFAEGSFIGKGIYDVDAFQQILHNRLPENLILSHDLLEGCYTRTGLLTDVLLYEDYPADYRHDMARRHRWIRGDWQVAGWLWPRVRGAGERRESNPISRLSRVKILDNLRRSLVAPALTLLLLCGWIWLPAAWFWTLCVAGFLFVPALLTAIAAAARRPPGCLPVAHLVDSARAAGRNLACTLFTLACLPFEAWSNLDAIARALVRMWITHARLLEWSPARHVARATRDVVRDYYRRMWIAPALAIAVLAWLASARAQVLPVAVPILLLWLIAPALAWQLSRPQRLQALRWTPEQRHFLRSLARRTWAYFETLIGPDDHWLPPDNYQEYPTAITAHRTSPTDMGLALLATLSAWDFGYLSAGQVIERCAHTFAGMRRLERYQGHFYNWYDTQSLQAMPPRYISSVDSGNLAGHLLVLRQGLLALPDQKILHPQFFAGLRDTLNVLLELADPARISGLDPLRATLQETLRAVPANLASARACLERLATAVAAVVVEPDEESSAEIEWWLQALARQCTAAREDLALADPPNATGQDAIPSLRELARKGNTAALERLAAIQTLAAQASAFADMDYEFLYDRARHLLALGYTPAERQRDASYYDLLASEARLASFVAIAQGKLPQEHWFALGRLLTLAGDTPVLVSWSGSMFEYLMPLLVMPTYNGTLLDQAHRTAVQVQIEYGQLRKVPWGISESCYNTLSAQFSYQYRAFGVPRLGLKRGLSSDLVIAPYASALALMVAPAAACANLQRMAAAGFTGRFGFYEAIDYTPARLPRDQAHAVVRAFMTHHQGMSLLSLAYALLDRPMQKRFTSDPAFQATTLLLQERIPKPTVFYPHSTGRTQARASTSTEAISMRVLTTPDTPSPEVQLLSNGRYHVMTSNAGGGYSRWNDIAVTRWREDGTRDPWGTFCYLRDAASGALWSATHQPTLQAAEQYSAIFAEGRAEYRSQQHGIETHTQIAVSPEDDIELRQIRITNRSRQRRVLDAVSYAEVVLAPPAADAAHPAFSNMFVETEILPARQAIVCSRRPRSAEERPPWMLHLVVGNVPATTTVSYETDRMRFVGRGHDLTDPQALGSGAPLSGTQGAVLDPVAAIRYRVTLDPAASVTINFVTGVTATHAQCLALVEKYRDWGLAHRVFDLAYTHGQIILRQLNASAADAQLYARLAGSVIYANPVMRAPQGVLLRNHRTQSDLWGYSISGDLPIVLLRIADPANMELVHQVVQAHAYWRLKGLAVDLVIWNESQADYRQQLHDQIMGLISTGTEASVIDRAGGIFVKRAEQISEDDRVLLQSVARVILADSAGPIAAQVNRRRPVQTRPPLRAVLRAARAVASASAEAPTPELGFFNGVGGFSPDGREYVITLGAGQTTPAPWVNVLANPEFGTLVSESGVANTWSMNSHEFRLTPWANDSVSDPAGEAFYIRDTHSGRLWSPTALPCRGSGAYLTRHGFGYSVFEHTQDGIRSELWMYVAKDAPVKFVVCKLRNLSGRARSLSVSAYVEWVLADLRANSMLHIVTALDPASGALLARNPYSSGFSRAVAFFDTDDPARSVSGDREEFLGRNGSLAEPAALEHTQLSGRVGAGLDPCGALQVTVDLAAGQEREVIFRLGVGRDAEAASALLQRYRGHPAARAALAEVRQYWEHTLDAVRVETPDTALNILANGWLVYQVIACRLWARTAFYQPSGAFGFRDQLQDVLAVMHTRPELTRAQLLLSAARQFVAGDVQHWWQTPSGRGLRSRCSDDYLWLPYVAGRYVEATGDGGILDESVPFLHGRALKPGEDSCYELPQTSSTQASLYDHCVRAITHGLTFGAHGLPLMGSGDWNDGMNKVGAQGRGESVWLGFFLHAVLTQFQQLALSRNDREFAERCAHEAEQLRTHLDTHAWDGAWYRRAWFDDGSLLGSSANTECQIDSIAQSWGLLSGAAPREHAEQAMQAVYQRLVKREQRLVQLLAPPFDTADMDPGYIKGYPPGVRENAGQYTHAAAWVGMAFAALHDRRRVWELVQLLNPLTHADTKDAIALYKVEPYVIASDVYSLPPYAGRGGWTWYTGSAGWMYQLIVESLLGLKRHHERLYIGPCLPPEWHECKLRYRYRETHYDIHVQQACSAQDSIVVTCDGIRLDDNAIRLLDDQRKHSVEVTITYVQDGSVAHPAKVAPDDHERNLRPNK